MIIHLNENQFNKVVLTAMLTESYGSDGNVDHNPYQKTLDRHDAQLTSFLLNNGVLMADIENGKQYVVYEILSFQELLGSRYGICKLMKDNEPYGAIYIKPMVQFRAIY